MGFLFLARELLLASVLLVRACLGCDISAVVERVIDAAAALLGTEDRGGRGEGALSAGALVKILNIICCHRNSDSNHNEIPLEWLKLQGPRYGQPNSQTLCKYCVAVWQLRMKASDPQGH